MMITAFSVFVVVIFAVAMIYGDWQTIVSLKTQVNRLWSQVADLEADKRALTESLCRANGTPYVQPRRESTLIPGSGWYDAPDVVYRKPEDEN